jgi:hypothetical protein
VQIAKDMGTPKTIVTSNQDASNVQVHHLTKHCHRKETFSDA